MKSARICIILLLFIISIGAVSATEEIDEALEIPQDDLHVGTENSYTFTNLTDEIDESGDLLDLQHDYTFNNESDIGYVAVKKDNFVINGNNHRLDGNNQTGIFNITGNNITINNLIFVNGNASEGYRNGGAIFSAGKVTLNNVTFINNHANGNGGAVCSREQVTLNNVTFINNHAFHGGAIVSVRGVNCSRCNFINNSAVTGGAICRSPTNCYESNFINNSAGYGSSIYLYGEELNIYNSYVTSKVSSKYGQIFVEESTVNIGNSSFFDMFSDYSPAVYISFCNSSIVDSTFVNLTANMTAGAISIKSGGNHYIRNCQFINVSSSKNAGAINADILGMIGSEGNVTIIDTLFMNASSEFGGAIIQLGGQLLVNNSDFINNNATFNGGAIFLSFVDAEINYCTFDSNKVSVFDGVYPTYGGALYFDNGDLRVYDSKFINNTAGLGNAIYAYDASYDISNTIFINNTNAIYTFFDKGSSLNNNTYNDDYISANNTYYETYVAGQGLELILINNTIDVTSLPSRFDLRDWGWVSPVRDQGIMGACWAFGITGVLESALLKYCGISTDFSENNLQNTVLPFSIYGHNQTGYEGGNDGLSLAYLLSWLGAFSQDADTYDEMGKISPLITTSEDIHVQDAIMVFNDGPGSLQIKSAIIKYGSVTLVFDSQSSYDDVNPFFNPETSAQYINDNLTPTHEVSVVGWDDDYSKENFLITPPGDGAWIVKNSWGTDWGDEGYLYVSYYDKTLWSYCDDTGDFRYATGLVFDNTVPYNKNYQYDICGLQFFDGNITKYCNVFTAEGNDLIAGVGTYFNESNVNYTIEIYVNDELRLVQNGSSPFRGYHTIQLHSFIPINDGDTFRAVVTSNSLSAFKMSRQHFQENTSFMYCDGEWIDLSTRGQVACLKVYTICNDSRIINNHDIVVDYGSESYFSVNVLSAVGNVPISGASVEFTINGKTINVTTDSEGSAKLQITENPGTYVVTAVFNNQTCENNVAVKLDLKNCMVVAEDISLDYASQSDFTVKVVSGDGKVAVAGESVIFVINGRTANATTDEDGIARIEITDVPGEYELITLFNGELYNNAVTVNHVLKASKAKVKWTAKKFALKARLKINGTLIKGENITFKFNGKKYSAQTNSKGIAKVIVKKNVIKKLKKGKKYKVKVTYLEDTIKTTVKVK